MIIGSLTEWHVVRHIRKWLGILLLEFQDTWWVNVCGFKRSGHGRSRDNRQMILPMRQNWHLLNSLLYGHNCHAHIWLSTLDSMLSAKKCRCALILQVP